MLNQERDTKELNSLLRGELSARESYRIAAKELNRPEFSAIRSIAADHDLAVGQLESAVRNCGGKPSESSGPWGVFAKAVTGTAAGMGEKATLKALKEGEEHGLKEYQSALEGDKLDATTRDLISSTLLPRQQQHIQAIDTCMKTAH